MADQSVAVEAVAKKINEEYGTLCNLMTDLSDGVINGTGGGQSNLKPQGGYLLGGITLDSGNASDPGVMLRISTGTTNQQVYTGQITDGAMKMSAMQRAISQMTNR